MKYYIEEIVDWHYAPITTYIHDEKPIYYYGLFTEPEKVKPIPSGEWYSFEIIHKTTLLGVRTYNGLMGKYNHRPCLKNEITKKYFEEIQVTVHKQNQPIEAENDDEAIEKFFNMKLRTY